MSKEVYRVTFLNQGQVYEIYARQIYQSELYGFVEVEEIVFGEKAKTIVDPAEERLKAEFEGVARSFIPMQSVIRIDEVEREGVAKITEPRGDKIMQFPLGGVRPDQSG